MTYEINCKVVVCIKCFFSKYFESMFTMEMGEKYQNEVEINHLDSEAVKLIIDYYYSGSIGINSKNVLEVLAAADYFQVNDVTGFCFVFLESGLAVGNCMGVISAYHLYKPECSLAQTDMFLSKNLSKISLEEKCQDFSEDGLTEIFS